jgi:hypothetical protein
LRTAMGRSSLLVGRPAAFAMLAGNHPIKYGATGRLNGCARDGARTTPRRSASASATSGGLVAEHGEALEILARHDPDAPKR